MRAKGWMKAPAGRMIALMGDAELDEGNIFEALLEGWKHELNNTWWIIDYNRQSLDGVVTEDLKSRIDDVFSTMGWEVVTIKHGHLQQAAFARPGGEKLRAWIDGCPNQDYSALTFQGGAAWRARLDDDIGDQGEVSELIGSFGDEDLAALMTNLGGHDLAAVLEAFAAVDHDRPVCFIAYTIKGHGTPLQGHKDNHAGIMNEVQMAQFKADMVIRDGQEWLPFEGLSPPLAEMQAFLAGNRLQRRRHPAASPPTISPCPTISPRRKARGCPRRRVLVTCSTIWRGTAANWRITSSPRRPM